MGGILGGLTDILFGKPETPEVNWQEIRNLLELGIDKNRYNQNGLFTSHNWDADKNTLTQSINPQLQPAMDALMGRINQGSPGYDGSGRFKGLIDALMSRERGGTAPPPQQQARQPLVRPDLQRPDLPQRPMVYRPSATIPEEYR